VAAVRAKRAKMQTKVLRDQEVMEDAETYRLSGESEEGLSKTERLKGIEAIRQSLNLAEPERK
jgi:hypothetical protein